MAGATVHRAGPKVAAVAPAVPGGGRGVSGAAGRATRQAAVLHQQAGIRGSEDRVPGGGGGLPGTPTFHDRVRGTLGRGASPVLIPSVTQAEGRPQGRTSPGTSVRTSLESWRFVAWVDSSPPRSVVPPPNVRGQNPIETGTYRPMRAAHQTDVALFECGLPPPDPALSPHAVTRSRSSRDIIRRKAGVRAWSPRAWSVLSGGSSCILRRSVSRPDVLGGVHTGRHSP